MRVRKGLGFLPFFLFDLCPLFGFCVTTTSGNSLVMTGLAVNGLSKQQYQRRSSTYHAVYPLTCFCKDELLYLVGARPTCEAMCMIALVARHDRFLGDRQLANVALIRAISAYGISIRK